MSLSQDIQYLATNKEHLAAVESLPTLAFLASDMIREATELLHQECQSHRQASSQAPFTLQHDPTTKTSFDDLTPEDKERFLFDPSEL